MALWLTRADVAAVLSMADAIEAVSQAFRLLSAGAATLPLRTNMAVTPHNGSLLTMPAHLGGGLGGIGGLGVKLITLYSDNPGNCNLPAIQGNFVLFDPTNGRLLAVMEAGLMTAIRTGAAGGVAARHLARPDAAVATIFGSGAQAPHQLEAVICERPVERVWVVSRSAQNGARFAAAMAARYGIPVQATADAKMAVTSADVVITATTSPTPLFDGRWLRPGTHITAIGSHLSTAREVDRHTIRRATVVTDQTSACLAEAGDLAIPLAAGEISENHIHAEIGQIVAGQKPGRTSVDEITFFKSVGLAVQDVAVARLVFEKAMAAGIGTDLEE
ncbi:MAG: ornithine cyclodeaminase family protein [Caldilineaceae bacterium]|nr:ornithine cyclodeaminase family protein [Caldilineaceae bacterium]